MNFIKKIAVIVGAAAATMLALSPAALAADNANVTPLYANSFSCNGAPASSQVPANQEGFVNFHLDGTTVTLNYHIKDAKPDATYYVFGYSGFCNYDGYVGSLVTNSNGVANADFTYTASTGTTQVWTLAYTFSGGFTGVETPATAP